MMDQRCPQRVAVACCSIIVILIKMCTLVGLKRNTGIITHGMENAKVLTPHVECFVLLYRHITVVVVIIIIIIIIIILLDTLFPLKGVLLWH